MRQPDDEDLPAEQDAGTFSSWLGGLEAALRGEAASDVPCGSCTACCTASQFVLIGPDETDTLAHVPAALRFPAPGLPAGHVLLGYDEHGRCPMLVDERCTIYEHRPRTCRTYDCRVFPASGVEADDGDPTKVGVADRARRWRFGHPTADDQVDHDAVLAAGRMLGPDGALADAGPPNATARAVLAVEVHAAFVGRDDSGRRRVVEPDPTEVLVRIRALTGRPPRG